MPVGDGDNAGGDARIWRGRATPASRPPDARNGQRGCQVGQIEIEKAFGERMVMRDGGLSSYLCCFLISRPVYVCFCIAGTHNHTKPNQRKLSCSSLIATALQRNYDRQRFDFEYNLFQSIH